MKQSKIGRRSSHRRATFRSVVTALFAHDRIKTTEARAKQIRPIAEKLITLAKRGDLHARRLVAAYVLSPDVVKKLFDDIGPKYKERPGGYTRIIKIGPRRGDASPEVYIELV